MGMQTAIPIYGHIQDAVSILSFCHFLKAVKLGTDTCQSGDQGYRIGTPNVGRRSKI
jgi:hypothetical protein